MTRSAAFHDDINVAAFYNKQIHKNTISGFKTFFIYQTSLLPTVNDIIISFVV